MAKPYKVYINSNKQALKTGVFKPELSFLGILDDFIFIVAQNALRNFKITGFLDKNLSRTYLCSLSVIILMW